MSNPQGSTYRSLFGVQTTGATSDLAMADNLGMQPDRITVTDKGLVIGFVLKPM
jgi:hypothetical protein